jgi:predicted ATP-binding protein involved in virulence
MARINEAPPQAKAGPRGDCSCEQAEQSRDTTSKAPRQEHVAADELANVDAALEAAEAYERFLALKQHRTRQLISNLKIKRDALAELGEALRGTRL